MSGKISGGGGGGGNAVVPTTAEGNSTVVPETALNTAFILSIQNQSNPKEIAASNKNISRIGNLCDVPPLTKLNISFNKLLESLDGIEQIPSLKEFWCYGCSIRDLSGLAALTKAEVLYLQHNKIDSIFEVFKAMNKLRELRLDGNRLRKVESLQSCQFLRRLDLSHNGLVAVDGLSGLQSLQELKLNHNKIATIAPLRGLPSLTEIDVSHNYLKSLDGIQHFLKLEIVRANGNHMVHLQLLPYASGGGATAPGKATALHTASGSTPLNTSRSTKSNASSTTTAAATAAGGGKGKRGAAAANAAAGDAAATKTSTLPTLDKPVLSELYLSGNKIRSISGLEMYQHCLEIFDLSRNQITDVLNITAVLRDTASLTELHLHDNPCVEDATQMMTLQNVLSANCPRFTMTFDAVVTTPEAVDVDELYHHAGGGGGGNEGLLDTISMASREFHTWAYDGDASVAQPGSTVFNGDDEDDAPSTKANTAASGGPGADNAAANKKKTATGADGEEGDEEEDENDEINRMFLGPKLMLRSMLTQEQIAERAQAFRDLLTHTKDKLNATVFQFLYSDSKPLGTADSLVHPPPSKAKKTPATATAAASADSKGDSRDDDDAKPPSAADKLRSVLDRAQTPLDPQPMAASTALPEEKASLPPRTTHGDAKATTTTATTATTTTHVAMPKQLLRSNSSSSKLMPSIAEGALEVASPPAAKPPRMASHANLHQPTATVTATATAAVPALLTLNDAKDAVPAAPLSDRSHFSSAASLASHATTSTVASKTRSKLHAQISANQHAASPESAARSSEFLDTRNLSSNVTSHGSKHWKASAVEAEAQQQARHELAQRMLQTGVVAPEDRQRHEDELLAFSTIKIAKPKQPRTLLVDAKVNIVTSDRVGGGSDVDAKREAPSPGAATAAAVPAVAVVGRGDESPAADVPSRPLLFSQADKLQLEREVSTPLSQITRQAPLLFLEYEGDDDSHHSDEDDDAAWAPAPAAVAVAEDDDDDAQPLTTPQSLPSVSFKPKSIGFDRRYLDEDDAVTLGSAPVLLTPRDLSLVMTAAEAPPVPRVVRAHSAPMVRPDTTTANAAVNSGGGGEPDAKAAAESSVHSVPATPQLAPSSSTSSSSSSQTVGVAPSPKVTVSTTRSGVQGGRLLQPSPLVARDLAADVHTQSMSSLLRFQLPADLQHVIDIDAKTTPKGSARTPRDGKATPSSSSSSSGAKDAVLFSDEDDAAAMPKKTSSSGAAMAQQKPHLADPVAAGKEQWVERIEAKIFALSSKEAKAAVQLTTPHHSLPSPSLFHPQSR